MADAAALATDRPAFEPKLSSFSFDEEHTWTFTLDLELDLTAEDLDETFELKGVPLPGDWTCEIKREGEDVIFAAEHGPLAPGALGSSVQVDMQLYWIHQKAMKKLRSAEFDKELHPAIDLESKQPYTGYELTLRPESLLKASYASPPLELKTQRQYRLRFTFKEVGPSVASAQLVIERVPEHDAPLTLGVNNVRLFFPKVGEKGAELWTSADLLSSSSPYLKDLLTSDFSEGIKVCTKRSRTSPAPVTQTVDASVQKDFEDSDDDTDIALLKADPPELHAVQDGTELAYRQITVTQAAYATWRAVLRYLETGFIRFAPLSSAAQSNGPSAILTRVEYIETARKYDPALPTPTSPKSTYRLAHLLQLEHLQQLCLAHLSGTLTAHSAAHELFDDAAVCYEDWRKVILTYVVKNWNSVSQSSSWKETLGQIEREDASVSGVVSHPCDNRLPLVLA
ncbi:hypothetical protein JCM10450v2_004864 [Rhodotorula kratochvilovae]